MPFSFKKNINSFTELNNLDRGDRKILAFVNISVLSDALMIKNFFSRALLLNLLLLMNHFTGT